jgi:dihydropteroate synthase
MSVVNVTPDSFSDGGRYLDADTAVARGVAQHHEGADLVDVGGESTRPGAERVSVDVELKRVLPVIEQLCSAGVVVSVDTMRAEVARQSIAVGATLVNDVSGGLADPEMLPFIASTSAPCILMHWRGHSVHMSSRADYPTGVVREVTSELAGRVECAVGAGVDERRIILDPGLGFAKNPTHNWELLRRIDSLTTLGLPLVVGASRKRFLGELLADSDGNQRPLVERDDATAAVSALAAAAGVWGVRVHDARSSLDAVRVAAAWSEGDGT